MIIRENESLEVIAILFKNKWIIVLFTIAMTIVSIVYSLNLDVQYKSTVNVVQPSSSPDGLLGGALSGISSKLKDFGITKVGGSSSGGQSYDLSVIMESRSVVDSIIKKYNLIETYKVSDSTLQSTRKVFSGNSEIVNYKEGNIELSIWANSPEKAANMANDYVEIVNNKAKMMKQKETLVSIEYIEKRIARTDSIIQLLGDSLNYYSKKYQIFSPEDQAMAYSEVLAELNAAAMKAETEYEITKNKLGEDDPYTKMLLDYVNQAKKRLKESKSEPGLIGNFSANDVGAVGMEYMRLYSEYEALSKMKLFLIPTLEKHKLDLNSVSNHLYVVDDAIPAEKKDRPKRAYIVLGTFAGSFIISIVLVLFINSFRTIKRRLESITGK